ncbi:hypothetical protein [Ideonella sp. BN130291]|uniref:hypothetical protein n=1 Tax=Ideonella sp. BN130291 TaxID=3112940 RepID=UPI002E2534CB|nr:hypothetical protein [Ideonella sp. BN130291]
MERFARAAALAMLVCTLAACGGSPAPQAVAAPAGGASGPTAQTITGVSTPTSVSVVTAKNAQ